MTRPAEPLTIESEGEATVCAPVHSAPFLASDETRMVVPHAFAHWYGNELRKEASFLARLFRISRGPMRISTALPLAVRLSWRDGELRRKWVAFSVMEEFALRTRQLPGATIETGLVDNAVRFTFSEDEPPLATVGPINVVDCEELAPLHCYRKRDAVQRALRSQH